MHHSELIKLVQKTRSVSSKFQIHAKGPLINIGENYWGLDYEDFGNSNFQSD